MPVLPRSLRSKSLRQSVLVAVLHPARFEPLARLVFDAPLVQRRLVDRQAEQQQLPWVELPASGAVITPQKRVENRLVLRFEPLAERIHLLGRLLLDPLDQRLPFGKQRFAFGTKRFAFGVKHFVALNNKTLQQCRVVG